MACAALQSGQQFLSTAIAHVDCQAQTIGAYGFAALADPASPTSRGLIALLTIFVALFGIRLLLGYRTEGRDAVEAILKVGIVLTLATSWPAWRVLGYDLVIQGPGEVARAIGLASALPGAAGDLVLRLQRVDDALALLNVMGSGRLGIAQGDWFQLGFARSAYLTSTLGGIALVRLMAGVLLALAPLFAGLLLFAPARALFVGWLRALGAVFLGSLILTLIQGAQLALMTPLLQGAMTRRQADQQVLDAPTEVLVLSLVFALVSFGALAFVLRIAFQPSSWAAAWQDFRTNVAATVEAREPARAASASDEPHYAQARSVALSVEGNIRREERFSSGTRVASPQQPLQPLAAGLAGERTPVLDPAVALGTSHRRSVRRVSAAGQRRDNRP